MPPLGWKLAFRPPGVGLSRGHIFNFQSVVKSQWNKNLGRLWHTYIRTTGRFYKLQLTGVDSWHFTQSEFSLGWSDLHEIKNVSFSFRALIRYATFVKVAPLVHAEKFNHLFAFIAL